MDKIKAGEAREAILEILQRGVDELKEQGYTARLRRGTYDEFGITFKLEVLDIVTGEDGEVLTREQLDYDAIEGGVGIKLPPRGTEVTLNGRRYRFYGWRPKATARPLIMQQTVPGETTGGALKIFRHHDVMRRYDPENFLPSSRG